MKPFHFQQFEIQQSKNVFRVGTDGVLLGALANVSEARNILEIGAGTGLISLMIAQRNPNSKILALDINEEAVNLATENFFNSPFSERMSILYQDFKTFQSENKFDLLISNPPYFEENSSSKDILARQRLELDFEDLISQSSKMISNEGVFSVIIPSDFANEFEELAIENKFFLIRKINIFGIEGGVLKRTILEFSKTKRKTEVSNFSIEKRPRIYSDHYIELTKEFHVFGKK